MSNDYQQTLQDLQKINAEVRPFGGIELLNLPEVIENARQKCVNHLHDLLSQHQDAKREIVPLLEELKNKKEELENKREKLASLQRKADKRETRIKNLEEQILDRETPKYAQLQQLRNMAQSDRLDETA